MKGCEGHKSNKRVCITVEINKGKEDYQTEGDDCSISEINSLYFIL